MGVLGFVKPANAVKARQSRTCFVVNPSGLIGVDVEPFAVFISFSCCYFLTFPIWFALLLPDFRYLSGEEVDGTAYVLFGVLQQGQKKSFPGSLQRVMVSPYFLYLCQSASRLVSPYGTECDWLLSFGLSFANTETKTKPKTTTHQFGLFIAKKKKTSLTAFQAAFLYYVTLDCGRTRRGQTEERAHHTDLQQHPRAGGEFHICICQRADGER